jgi:Na+-transporting NADH:ubiquinone oxidoreductase subunit NqrD
MTDRIMANKNNEAFKQPLWVNNPVLVQILGICSALAVTAQLKPAIVMGLSVTVIVAMSNVIIHFSAILFLTVSVSSSSWWWLLLWLL